MPAFQSAHQGSVILNGTGGLGTAGQVGDPEDYDPSAGAEDQDSLYQYLK